MEFIKLLMTSILSVASIFVITKLMGHKQVAQLDFFDYVCGITIGSVAAEMATDIEAPWKSLVALIVYGLTSIILGVITHKFPKSRKYINGTPTILMDKGRIYRKNLKKAKLDLSEFLLLCREAGYFDISEIETAVFEHNGKLSVLPRSEFSPPSAKDMGLTPEQKQMEIELIMDGEIMGENLKRLGRDESWLRKALLENSLKSEKDVFLAVYNKDDDSLQIYLDQ